MEDYKVIDGFENYVIYKNSNVVNLKTGKIIKPALVSKGYYLLTLCNKGNQRRAYIHRLVAEAFIPNPLKKETVNHINGIMTDNSIENLEWNTMKENINHAYRIGLCPTKIKALQGGKLSETNVLLIREKLSNQTSIDSLAKEFNVCPTTIEYVRDRRTWKHI